MDSDAEGSADAGRSTSESVPPEQPEVTEAGGTAPPAGDAPEGEATGGASRNRTRWITIGVAAVVIVVAGAAIAFFALRSSGSKKHPPRPPNESAAPAAVSDNFSRADSTTSLGTTPTGQPWFALRGVWGIQNHAAYASKPLAKGLSIATVSIGTGDGTVEMKVGTFRLGMGLVFRCRVPRNCWEINAIQPPGGAPTWNVQKVFRGKVTPLGALGPVPAADGTTLAVRMVGPQITILVDGVVRKTINDPNLQHVKRDGISVAAGSGAGQARWSSFTATVSSSTTP